MSGFRLFSKGGEGETANLGELQKAMDADQSQAVTKEKKPAKNDGSVKGDMQALRASSTRGKSGLQKRQLSEHRQAVGAGKRDGRSLRATGRTAQLNTKLRPEMKDRIQDIAISQNIYMAEVIEQAMALLEEKLKG